MLGNHLADTCVFRIFHAGIFMRGKLADNFFAEVAWVFRKNIKVRDFLDDAALVFGHIPRV